jgi:hypothetical protein
MADKVNRKDCSPRPLYPRTLSTPGSVFKSAKGLKFKVGNDKGYPVDSETAGWMDGMHATSRRVRQALLLMGWLALLAWGESSALAQCAVCRQNLGQRAYLCTDLITLKKLEVCTSCTYRLPDCFLCSIPVRTNKADHMAFADGRVLCKRDAMTAVAEPKEGERIGREMRDWMEREFSRFMEFPDTNYTLTLVDRPTLEASFKFPGRDWTCPDIWGTTQALTNHGVKTCEVNILAGLPLALLKHTAAHELAHVWLIENVPAERYRRLDRDANEGFCELLAWIADETCPDAELKAYLRRNLYTRGQIDVYLDLYRGSGMNDIVEWLKYGVDKRLVAGETAQITKVAMPVKTNAVPATNRVVLAATQPAAPEYAGIILQGITWSEKAPLALINGKTLGANEEARIRVGGTNLVIQCVEIRKSLVRIRVAGVEQELALHGR